MLKLTEEPGSAAASALGYLRQELAILPDILGCGKQDVFLLLFAVLKELNDRSLVL
jgi:hypothetical protein